MWPRKTCCGQTRSRRFGIVLRQCGGLAVSMLCAAVLATRVSVAAAWPGWAVLPAESVIRQSYGEEDAVVLLDEWEISLKGGTRTGTHRRVSRLLTEKGRSDLAMSLARGSFDSFSRVKVWVREPSGRTRVFDQDQGTLLSVSSERVLDDTEILVLEPWGASPGSTVAVEYRFASKPDIPQDLFSIQESIPVRHATVKIDAHGGWRVHAKVAGGTNPGPEDVSGEGIWDFTDVPGMPASPQWMAPEPQRLLLVLDYKAPDRESDFRDWSSTAMWGAALFPAASSRPQPDTTSLKATAKRSEPHPSQPGSGPAPPSSDAASAPPRIEREIARLRAEKNAADPIDLVGRLVRKLRYFAIEIGWGGYRPRTPDTTLARGFGDCKDKSSLMVSLLRGLGVEAFPVLAVAPRDRFVSSSLPGPRLFNHCVVGIPWRGRERSAGMTVVNTAEFGPLRIFDPTLSESSAQDIHFALEGGAGLPLDARTKQLLRMPRSSEAENLYERSAKWRVSSDGSLVVRLVSRHSGVTRTYLEGDGESLLTTAKLRERLFDAASRLHPRAEHFEISNIRREGDGPWTYETSYRAPDVLAIFGDLEALDLPSLSNVNLFPIPNEKKPVSLYQPYLATFREIVDLDVPGREVVDPPKGFETTNALGSVTVAVRQEGGHLIIERTVTTRSLEIGPARREDARALQRALRRANAMSIVVRPVSNRPMID